MLSSALGRLPIAMFGLATLLYVQRVSGSFAAAGLVTAGALVGVSLGSVAQGRLMDRIGPTRPLLVLTALFAVAVAALITAVETAQPLPLLVLLALVTGLTEPALPAASRALWGVLLPPGRAGTRPTPTRRSAWRSSSSSARPSPRSWCWRPGPAPGWWWPRWRWCWGRWGSRSAARSATGERPPPGSSVGLLGALAEPAMRTVAVASLGFGVVVGTVEVGVPAVTAAVGSPALGGVLISAWSVTSVLAGLLYSLRPWPRPLHLRMPVLLGAFAVLVGAMALVGPSGSLVVLTLAMLAAGALITPQVTAHSIAIDAAAPAGTATEAFGWVITAATLGLAIGQSVAGVVVEAAGPPAAFLAGGVAGVLLAGVLWARRRTLLRRAGPRS